MEIERHCSSLMVNETKISKLNINASDWVSQRPNDNQLITN